MLKATLDHLSSALTPKRPFEIIIVDDGSTDGTSDVALSFFSSLPKSSPYTALLKTNDVRLVTLERNAGKGAAVRHGFLHARGERILMVDADGASQFEDLEKLWEGLDGVERSQDGGEKLGVAIGSRAHLVGTEAVVKVRSVILFNERATNFALAKCSAPSFVTC
jgi:dolichyl-phosphate beta-glucosyltransferase